MAKKRKSKVHFEEPAITNEMVKEIEKEITNTIENGLGDAIGFPSSAGGFGFPGAGSALQPVEDSATAFTNLRYYLVSNFRQLLSQLYAEIGLVQTICVVPVDDALRGGVDFKTKQLDEQQIKDLKNRMKREDDFGKAKWAGAWNRLFGGAGILILVADQDPEDELDISKITLDSKLEFRACDMWELFYSKQNIEGYDPVDIDDELDYFNYYGENVNTTRVIKLKGIEAPSFIRPRLRGWGLSVVEALIRSMNQYLKATDLGFEVLDEFKVDYYKIKNLTDVLLSSTGTAAVSQRIQMANWQKNYQNAVVLDSEDEFEFKQLSFAGLAEAMEGIRMQVAADMRMPITKLFGTSASKGLGPTDQNDMENYNSMVEGDVRAKLEYPLLQMAELRCQEMFGMIPDDLELEWKPLRELPAVDQENVKTQKYTRLAQSKAAGDITNQEFRDAANKGNLFDVQLNTLEDLGEADINDPELEDVLTGEAQKEMAQPEGAGADKDDTQGKDKKPKAKKNSKEFDKASFESDNQDMPGREVLFEGPDRFVDKALYKKVCVESQDIFGQSNTQFIMWQYKKLGGQFT